MKLQVTKQRKRWWAISSILILAGLISMVISWQQIGSPLRPGLDFVGGTRLQFELDCSKNDCNKPVDIASVRTVLEEEGLGSSSVQEVTGQGRRGILIRSTPLDVDQRTKLQTVLSEKIGTFDPSKTQIDTVGPIVGQQLFSAGMLALLVSFVGITVYMSMRFQLDYAVFAIVALFHDVLITIGIFSMLGLILHVEIDSLFIVALLTIVGFSVNDTVVIYDRVRETLALNPEGDIDNIVDAAVDQTLTRSINTTVTVLLSLVSIFLFGGETLKYFALALIIGFSAGAYSSIFVASTLLAWWRKRSGKALPAVVATSPEVSDSPSIDGNPKSD
ncbi:protein translocase subunit SecF [Kovacikia minuta CCNUW1]|uniref:protein translocase subunit SecF n=1 Tax=Kovacikia minuta TaxID=2931930 RepID=UPI001CCA8E3F|nr:protein translocase subunit SecF [Kovacikia minuta]UBF29217.1 protein translocase subunit SecF [Kovacikia minuta CCNUW1]